MRMQFSAILEKPIRDLPMNDDNYAKVLPRKLISHSNDELYTLVDKI